MLPRSRPLVVFFLRETDSERERHAQSDEARNATEKGGRRLKSPSLARKSEPSKTGQKTVLTIILVAPKTVMTNGTLEGTLPLATNTKTGTQTDSRVMLSSGPDGADNVESRYCISRQKCSKTDDQTRINAQSSARLTRQCTGGQTAGGSFYSHVPGGVLLPLDIGAKTTDTGGNRTTMPPMNGICHCIGYSLAWPENMTHCAFRRSLHTQDSLRPKSSTPPTVMNAVHIETVVLPHRVSRPENIRWGRGALAQDPCCSGHPATSSRKLIDESSRPNTFATQPAHCHQSQSATNDPNPSFVRPSTIAYVAAQCAKINPIRAKGWTAPPLIYSSCWTTMLIEEKSDASA